jgi:hypothetical protein
VRTTAVVTVWTTAVVIRLHLPQLADIVILGPVNT